MGNFMLTVIYDYGKLEHSAPLTDSWIVGSFESCVSELERTQSNGARFISINILNIPEDAQ